MSRSEDTTSRMVTRSKLLIGFSLTGNRPHPADSTLHPEDTGRALQNKTSSLLTAATCRVMENYPENAGKSWHRSRFMHDDPQPPRTLHLHSLFFLCLPGAGRQAPPAFF